jgi:MFS family permease
MALSSGTDRSFGVAVIPLSEQFGWSRATLSTVVLVTGIVSSLFQLMIGVLVDRVGPRYVLAAGVACLGVAVWLLTGATTIWQFGLAYGVLGGLGLAATRQVVAATLVGNWFAQRRGFMQGMVGSALGVECRLQRDDLGHSPRRLAPWSALRLHRHLSARLAGERRRCLGRQFTSFRAA